MRKIVLVALLAAGCQNTSPDPYVVRAAAVPEPVPCTREAVFEAGAAGAFLPPNCKDRADLFDAYRLGQRTFSLEEELREVNYRVAKGSYLGFGSKGYLISRRVELKNAIRSLRRQARVDAG